MYSDDSCPTQLRLRNCSWVESRGVSYVPQVREAQMVKILPVWICMCGSIHHCGCVVNGSNAMAAS